MRLFLITFFVFAVSVCIDSGSERGAVQGRYHFNHPPWAEDYNPIPVAVVYEDDTTGIVIKPEVEPESKQNKDLKSSIEEKSHISENPVIEADKTRTDTTKSVTDSGQDNKALKPKARALSDLQIPVAVVYDNLPESTPSSRQITGSEIKNNRRKVKQLIRRKLQNKTSIITERLVNQNAEPTTPHVFVSTETFATPRSSEAVKSSIKSKQDKRERDPVVPILNSENYVFAHNGDFHYSYEGGDGTKAHSHGQLMRNLDDEAAGEAVSGGFSYTDKDGNDFSLSYTADERGYRPVGAHLPTSPPIPPAIARALAYLATATTPEPVTKPAKT